MKKIKNLLVALSMLVMTSSYAAQKNAQMEVTFTVLSQCQTMTTMQDNTKEMNVKIEEKCTSGTGMYVTTAIVPETIDKEQAKRTTMQVIAENHEGVEKYNVNLTKRNEVSKVIMTINY